MEQNEEEAIKLFKMSAEQVTTVFFCENSSYLGIVIR